MSIPSGMAAQLGIAAETTYGTAVTVDRFYPLVNETMTQDIDPMESAGIIAGARVLRSEQWAHGRIDVTGDVGLELFQQQMGLWVEHILGSITSSATGGVATHTATPGDLTGKSLTVQIGKPDTSGTVQPHTYAGVKVAGWELAVASGEIVTLGLTLLAQSETTGISLETASFGTDAARPYHYVQGAVSIAGSPAVVRELTVGGETPLSDEREAIGQQFIDEPLENELREYTGTITAEFRSLTEYNRFVAGDEFSVVLSLSASASAQATITMNARYDGITPTVEGRDLLVREAPIKCIASSSSDASALTAVIVNSQTSP